VDIKIEYVGLRPGEKLYEELITDGEDVIPTSHEKILVLRGAECHLGALNGSIDELSKLAREQDAEAIKKKLQKTVPEYRPQLNRTREETEQAKGRDDSEAEIPRDASPPISPAHLGSA
jgi:FlaA1/EpsC-like NDP-sugar epimerase